MPIQIYWKFHLQKLSFQIKTGVYIIFHISAQDIDCLYSLEQPHRGCSNKYPQSVFDQKFIKIMYIPCKPQFYCIKVGFKGIKIIKVCLFLDRW